MSATSSSSSSDSEDHRLGRDVRLAFDAARSIIDARPSSSFPIDIHFIVFAVIDGRGSFVQPHKVTLRRPDPELLEELYAAVWEELCNRVPDHASERAVDFVIKDVRMRIKSIGKRTEKCHFCHGEFVRLRRHMDTCTHAQGNYCSNCKAYITQDFLQHSISCRSRLYHCSGCGNDFLHASTLRAHRRQCSELEDGEEVSYVVVYFPVVC